LVYYDRWMNPKTEPAGGRPHGPGAAYVGELGPTRTGARAGTLARWTAAERLAILIAIGIGLHNFSEGLAIGQSAAKGEVSLAMLLVIGFGLHNSTEGFGIVAPLATEPVRPSWRFLLLLGLTGGGPTFFGTVVGQAWVNTA